MKRKYYAICIVALLLAALSAAGVRSYQVVEKYRHVSTRVQRRPMSEIHVPDPTTMEKMAQLEGVMSNLLTPQKEKELPLDLRAFGYRPVKRNLDIGEKIYAPGMSGHSLSMVFLGGNKNFCIIDGGFHPEGTKLSDGSKITAVKRDRVLLTNGRIERWIMMKRVEKSDNNQTNQEGERKP